MANLWTPSFDPSFVPDWTPDFVLSDGGAPPGPTLWTPANLASGTLVGWWDASDSATITEATGGVSQVADKSGLGNHLTQTTSSARPSVNTGAADGKDSILFNGSTDFLDMPALGISGSTNRTVYAVLRFAGVASNNPIITINDSGGTGTRWTFNGINTDLRVAITGSNTTTSTLTLTASTILVAGVVLAGTTLADHTFWLNGTSEAGSGGSTVNTTNAVGRIGETGGNFLNGELCEMVVVSGTVSSADNENLQGALAWKWGREGDLPGGHTYKSSAPTV